MSSIQLRALWPGFLHLEHNRAFLAGGAVVTCGGEEGTDVDGSNDAELAVVSGKWYKGFWADFVLGIYRAVLSNVFVQVPLTFKR